MTFENIETQELKIDSMLWNLESNIENKDRMITFFSNLNEENTNKITKIFDKAFA